MMNFLKLSVLLLLEFRFLKDNNLLACFLIKGFECLNHAALPFDLSVDVLHLTLEILQQIGTLFDSQALLGHFMIILVHKVGNVTFDTCLEVSNLLLNGAEIFEGKTHVVV